MAEALETASTCSGSTCERDKHGSGQVCHGTSSIGCLERIASSSEVLAVDAVAPWRSESPVERLVARVAIASLFYSVQYVTSCVAGVRTILILKGPLCMHCATVEKQTSVLHPPC